MRDTVLVSIDYDDKTNTGVLCVGRQLPNKSVDIVNAIAGSEAKELFKKLITKKADTDAHIYPARRKGNE